MAHKGVLDLGVRDSAKAGQRLELLLQKGFKGVLDEGGVCRMVYWDTKHPNAAVFLEGH